MLQVQTFLKNHSLKDLEDVHKIDSTHHETLPLVILNYNAPEVRKVKLEYHEITRECRSLCLEKDTWRLVSRAFRRFYNLGEYKEETFNWEKYKIQEKKDGSLISLYYYNEQWMVRTSGSFGSGKICGWAEHTWSNLVFSLIKPKQLDKLNPALTYVFELTSPFNQVVKPHKTSSITLLGIFDNHGAELSLEVVDVIADSLGFTRPLYFSFKNTDEAIKWLETQEATFEGFVLVDNDLNRIKLKGIQYLRLHRLKGNSNLFLARNVIPLIIEKPEEKGELTTYFEELKPIWEKYESEINKIFTEADEIYKLYHDYDKKQFALAIKGEPKFLKSILFTARTLNKLPSEIKRDLVDFIVRVFEEKYKLVDITPPEPAIFTTFEDIEIEESLEKIKQL